MVKAEVGVAVAASTQLVRYGLWQNYQVYKEGSECT
jgi:hypothetical protein